ncbi:MAG TPA: glycosyltransferase family 39 protein [Chloroflexota bacterium]|nr:glycosyltransferase family 39 protein [Chloroflexota bacterium]
MVSVTERPTLDAAPDDAGAGVAPVPARRGHGAGSGASWHLAGFAVVVALALVARFWGLLYGLPHSYYPDESSVVGDALKMATTGDLRPTQFLWPTLWIYVVALSLRAGLLASTIPGALGPLGIPALDNMTYVYGMARSMTALSGVMSVALLYFVAVCWFERIQLPSARLCAVLAAGFFALSPLHIQHSHVTSPDVPTTAFLVLAAYFVLRILETGQLRWYVLGGLALGLSSAAKYPSAMFAVALVIAHLSISDLSVRRPWQLVESLLDRRLWAAGLVTVVAFFGTSPYILLDWQRFLADFVSQANRVLQRGPVGEVGVSGPFAPVLYVPLAMQWGLDAPVALLAVVGLAFAAWLAARPGPGGSGLRWALLTMLVFPALLYVFSWSWQHRFARYLVPLVPFGCLLAALGVAGLARVLARQFGSRRAVMAACALGIAAMVWQADGVVRYDLLLTREDTRMTAARWLEKHLPPGEQVMVEWYGPSYSSVRQMGFDLSDRPLDRYVGRSPRYVVTSSFSYDRWLRNPEQFARRAAFYEELHTETPLLYEIRPWPELEYDPVQEGWDGWHILPLDPEARPGPVLRVHQLTP